MSNRSKFNKAILNKILNLCEQNDDLRFMQVLSILDLDEERFYEESKETYLKVDKILKQLNIE